MKMHCFSWKLSSSVWHSVPCIRHISADTFSLEPLGFFLFRHFNTWFAQINIMNFKNTTQCSKCMRKWNVVTWLNFQKTIMAKHLFFDIAEQTQDLTENYSHSRQTFASFFLSREEVQHLRKKKKSEVHEIRSCPNNFFNFSMETLKSFWLYQFL